MNIKKEFEYIENHFENIDKETLIEELEECGLKITNEKNHIECVGIDMKRHVCKSDEVLSGELSVKEIELLKEVLEEEKEQMKKHFTNERSLRFIEGGLEIVVKVMKVK